MKSDILDINGKKIKEIELPKCFSHEIREDIISKVLESKKTKQPYSPSLTAGKQHSAKGKLVHRRHVWRSQYGRGMSRVPRKILSERGSQFNWVGAEVPQARGGMRAHPPKTIHMLNTKKINKKELKSALFSAISATADLKKISEKYRSINEKEIKNKKFPLIVETKISELKTKQIINSLKDILGKELYKLALRKKSQRAGKGKFRGRKYKKNAGMLLVLGKNEKLKTNLFEVASANNLSINSLARGGSGRLVIYTENAIKSLEEKFKGK